MKNDRVSKVETEDDVTLEAAGDTDGSSSKDKDGGNGLVFGIIGIIIAGLAIFFIIILLKRRKKDEESK